MLRRIRRQHGDHDRHLMAGAAGHVAVPQFPPPRRRLPLPQSWLAWVALAIGAVVATVYIIWPAEVVRLLGL